MHPAKTALFTTALAACLVASPSRAAELRNFDDAPLHAVQFVDAREGWAVGDEGVVWHTIDGGKNWERQTTGVRASLRSLHFLTPYVGWVAGREELPGGQSAGVLLFTNDGGIEWKPAFPATVPGLNWVHFVDDKLGYIAGDGSESYPTGVFVTKDSGAHWNPVPGPRFPSWLAGTVMNGSLLVGGAWGRLGVADPERIRLDNYESLGSRAMGGMYAQASPGKLAVAAGQGGMLLLNDGSGWSPVDSTNLSRDVRQSLDLHAVHGAGTHIWAVGRPGSVILHSQNNGSSWEIQFTRQNLPLNGVFFLDDRQGWAVGEYGMILTTTDSGKNWMMQRRGGERAAALFVHSRPTGFPLDTVALLGGQDGYLTAGVRVVGPDPGTAAPGRCTEEQRLVTAFRQAGGGAAEMLWQFPLGAHAIRSPRDDLVQIWEEVHGKTWNQPHGANAADNLLRQLVLAIRIWRPDVIVTDCPAVVPSGFSSDGLVSEVVREAFRQAADPKAFPEHINSLGLQAWQPTKVYARWEGQSAAEINIDLTAVNAVLRATLLEFASGPMTFLSEGRVSLPKTRLFRFLAGVKSAENDTSLMQGIDLHPEGVARRAALPAAKMTMEEERAIRQRATLLALSETQTEELNAPERLLSTMDVMLKDVPDDVGGRAAFAIARQFAEKGNWALASEAFFHMTERYPAHPATAEAFRWLIAYYSSSETRRVHEENNFAVKSLTGYGIVASDPKSLTQSPSPTKPPAGAFASDPGAGHGRGAEAPRKIEMPTLENHTRTIATGTEPAVVKDVSQFAGPVQVDLPGTLAADAKLTKEWFRFPQELQKRLATFGPLYANDPRMQFCLQAARRELGEVKEAQAWYTQFAARKTDGPWHAAAEAECWLVDRTREPSSKPMAKAHWTGAKPYLDGKLDDPCWKDAAMMMLWQASNDGPNTRSPNDPKAYKKAVDEAVRIVPPMTDSEAYKKALEEAIRSGRLKRMPAAPDDPRAFEDALADASPEVRQFLQSYPTEVRLAYDDDFLYVGVRCFHPPDKHVPPVKNRTRDADLRAFDRVSILLDLDRDYSTYFHLQIDQRGCVAEDCWGDKSWNPRWFVAVNSEATVWTAEAAIPLTALTHDTSLTGKAWAFNAVRVLPGRGVQAWSLPAEVPEESPRPEGMGLLLFTKEAPGRDQTAVRPMPAAR